MKRGVRPLFTELPVTLRAQQVAPGGTFVALQGFKEHGVKYVETALQRGVRSIVIEESSSIDRAAIQRMIPPDIQVSYTDQGRKIVAQLSAAYHNYPARSACMIGITGTKGKTTTTYLIHHILQFCGYHAALLSTVDHMIMDEIYAGDLTTPQADYLHAFMRHAVDRGVTHIVMEVAAQALSTQRVEGIAFDRVIWLNFAQEHAEFYQTMDDYFEAKERLLEQVKQPSGIIFASCDDKRIEKAVMQRSASHVFFSRNKIRLDRTDMAQSASWYEYEGSLFLCKNLYGEFNGENIIAALNVVCSLGIDRAHALEALSHFPGVPGRMNWYQLPRGVRACIDYAHTPASFQGILSELRRHTNHLIVVFGAGGERDTVKRPLMGSIAAQLADEVIVTSDNPRFEDPEKIIQDICSGITQRTVVRELDREKAIQRAYHRARSGSIIAVLGKGPDEYQIIQGNKYSFSEREILENL